MTFAYSVRFSRCSAGCSRVRMFAPQRHRDAFRSRWQTRRATARSGRRAPLGGIIPVLILRITFSQVVSVFIEMRIVQRVEHQARGLGALVVAGDAVLIE